MEEIKTGICPKCSGNKVIPAGDCAHKTIMAGYDKHNDTFVCDNCGGQQMYGKALGVTYLRQDGSPCLHEYTSTKTGNCLHKYACKHCAYQFSIDSGD